MHAVEHGGLRLIRDSQSDLQLLYILDHCEESADADKVQHYDADVRDQCIDGQWIKEYDVPAHKYLYS